MTARILIAAVMATACYAPSVGQREQTTVADDARPLLAKLVKSPASDAERKREFDRHYGAAMAAYKSADYAQAIAEFEAAYAIDAQPLLIFNIAQAFRKAGQLDQALVKYREYLERDPSAEREHVTELIDAAERELARRKH
jgi:tetratricopeptide (TPR) repeat protein